MSWVVIALENTLVTGDGGDDSQPVPGAQEAVQRLIAQGHRVTIYTSKFATMPQQRRQEVKTTLTQELQSWGFPPEMDVWSGYDKPMADFFIGANHITFDRDWNLALAQLRYMLAESGQAPAEQGGGMTTEDAVPQEGPTPGPLEVG